MNIGNALSGAQSFIFGGGADAPTYEALRRKREIADLLQQQAFGGEYENWGDGVGMVMKALGHKLIDRKLAPQEDAERQRITDLLGGGGGRSPVGAIGGAPTGFTGAGVPDSVPGMGAAPAPAQGQPVAPAVGGPTGYRDAIASIESAGSGDYSAVGPVTGSGDRAYGRYQVMGANIPEWSQQALGRAVTPEEFIANPQIQDAVFDHRFGGYAQKYGPEGAARAWFSGEGGMSNPSASDGNLTNDQYASRFMGALGGGGMPDLSGMMGGQPDMSRVMELAEVVSNPYATEGQKLVAQAMIEQSMGGGMDPYQAARLGLDYQRLELDRDKFASGTREGPKFYGNTQWAQDPETGQLRPYQIGTDGSVNWIDLGGANPLPPTRSADLGTSIMPIGPGGQPVGPVQTKDVAGAAAQKEVGTAAGTAAVSLGDREIAVQAAVDQIDRIISNEALPSVTGMVQGRLPGLGQASTDVISEIEGLQSKAFANAIDALRGLGAMTEAEGRAATQALANLDRKKGTPEFKAELERMRQFLLDKLEVARAKAAQVGGAPAAPAAGGGIPQAALDAGIDPNLWGVMTPEEQALWQN